MTSIEPANGAPNKGTFILSLDCEGKWGMADRITRHHDLNITRANLIDAYKTIARLLKKTDTPATFAFVMAFVLNSYERRLLSERFRDVSFEGKNWLRHFRTAEKDGDCDGWFCAEALEIIEAEKLHEIACHGFSHLPFDEAQISDEVARLEIESALMVANLKEIKLETFVFPRNHIGHVNLLAEAGFIGFRTARLPSLVERQSRILARGSHLAQEFNLLECADGHLPSVCGLQQVPAGFFLNWRNGYRRLVPQWITRQRWKNILRDAVEQRRVAHLWLHPHNLIDGPSTLELLEDILDEVNLLRRRGEIEILTQSEYVRRAKLTD